MNNQGLGKAGVRRMMSEQVKKHGPHAIWCGLRGSEYQRYWARLISKYVFGNTTQLPIEGS